MTGQKRLKNAKVLVIGAGGLGSPALLYLAAAGVGTLGIAEFDEVDESNLQRQIIHQQSDIGKSKAQSATANESTYNHKWTVNPTLRTGPDGLDRFNALAAQCYVGAAVCPTKQMAIVVAGRVLSAPTINAPAFEADRIEISGNFTEEEARSLAALLDLGNLPVVLAPR